MRLVVDVERRDETVVEGVVSLPGHEPSQFSGWLELLQVLEDLTGPEVSTTGVLT